MDNLPAEILREIISPQSFAELKALRLAGSHIVATVATEHLFSSVLLKHNPSSASKFSCILADPAKASFVREFTFDSDTPRTDDELELDAAVSSVLQRLPELPNLQKLRIIFSGEKYLHRKTYALGGGEPPHSTSHETFIFRDAVHKSLLLNPLPKLSALRIDNADYVNDQQFAQPPAWTATLSTLTSLELHVALVDFFFESGLPDLETYCENLGPIWLQPCAQTLTSLTLGSEEDVWWGTFPSWNLSDVPELPRLERMELVRFGFGRDEQFEWIFGLADKLRSLTFRDCAILYCTIDENIDQVCYWKSWAWVWEQILKRELKEFAHIFREVELSEEDDEDLDGENGWTVRYMSYDSWAVSPFHYYVKDMDGAGSSAPNYPRFLELEEMDRIVFEKLAEKFEGCRLEDVKAIDRRTLKKLMSKIEDPKTREMVDPEFEALETGDGDIGVPVVEFYGRGDYDWDFIWERDERDYRLLTQMLKDERDGSGPYRIVADVYHG